MKHPPPARPGDDGSLLAVLRGSWEALDPVPADLAERSLFSVALLGLDAEVARLVQDALVGAGTRSTEECVRTITFSSESLTATISVSDSLSGGSRIDGWLAPAEALRVELRRTDEPTMEVRADQDGRFVLDGVPAGLMQFVFHPMDPESLLATPVAAPPVRL